MTMTKDRAVGASPVRTPRCRFRVQRDNPCPNEVIDADPKAMQICAHHALLAVQLLAEAGAIEITYAKVGSA